MILLAALEVLGGIFLILAALGDAFETVILPRTVKRAVRLSRLLYSTLGAIYTSSGRLKSEKLRQSILVSFAPTTLFALMGFWALILILGFALVSDGLGVQFRDNMSASFANRLYFSGATFFTLGFGDFTPMDGLGKVMAILEGGTGFGFLALVISYIPVYYTAFSSREHRILLLDSKAGSEPTAREIIRRHADADCLEELPTLLKDWELFSAQLLENFLSYPVLAFYRSQHDDQSWLTSLTAVMDACALCMHTLPDNHPHAKRIRFQASATFVMARHLVVDFAYVLAADPVVPPERLPQAHLAAISAAIAECGLHLQTEPEAVAKLTETRRLYEPFCFGLSKRLMMSLPTWMPLADVPDNWETTAWDGNHF